MLPGNRRLTTHAGLRNNKVHITDNGGANTWAVRRGQYSLNAVRPWANQFHPAARDKILTYLLPNG